MPPAKSIFIRTCLFEGGLGLVALIVQWLFGRRLMADFHWEPIAILTALAATLPPLAFFAYAMQSSASWLKEIRAFLDRAIRPIFGSWRVWQLALISVLAGWGEELFFRAMLQGLLTTWLGRGFGLILASLIFGAFHPMSRGYFVVATAIGCYLGLLWWQTDNLLAPIVTHATYDFLALLYFLREPPDKSGTAHLPPGARISS